MNKLEAKIAILEEAVYRKNIELTALKFSEENAHNYVVKCKGDNNE